MLKGMIFDFDGVVVDSEKYWAEVENEVFLEVVQGWKYGDHVAIVGMSHLDIHAFLNKTYGTTFTAEEFSAIQDTIADKVYSRSQLIPGVTEFIQELEKHSIPISIASSSKRIWIEEQIQTHGIAKSFSYITTAEEVGVGKGKPHPAIYELAASKLDLDPKHCLVIEDSKHGITSAVGAGTYCLGLRTDMNEGQDLSDAAEIITGYDQIDTEKLFSK